MEVIKGYPIKEWEPNGQDKTKGDFLIDVNGTKVFCEVKSPSWESELSEEEKKNERKKEGKYVEKAEVRSFATWEKIRFTIEKAYRQLPSDVPTLLIIIDDLFCPILATPANQIDIALYSETTLYGERRGFFYDKEFCNLSGILFLNVHKYLDKHEVEYRSQFKKNGHVNFDLEISV
jgi:hypothetical protein